MTYGVKGGEEFLNKVLWFVGFSDFYATSGILFLPLYTDCE